MLNFLARKGWLVLISILLTLSLAVYILIPSRLEVSCLTYAVCNGKSASRALGKTRTWALFRPGFQGSVREELPLYIALSWPCDNRSYATHLVLIPKTGDTLVLNWNCEIPTPLNPARRLLAYFRARGLKDSMDRTLGVIRSWLKEDNIYKIPIRQIISSDSSLVFIQESLPHEPTIPETYLLVHRLQAYIAARKAKQTNPPMRHVIRKPDGKFELMVAVPTDRDLPGGGDIQYKRFVPWRTLVATVLGGPASVRGAGRTLQFYIEDHDRVSMAMPFESLLTDREREPDTTKWITQVCQPVF